jgi:Zn-finger nucleic acid-binding protein
VWLDRGELDKILDRATADTAAPAAAPAQQHAEPQYREPRHDNRQQQPYRKKKKEHWLSELFD